MQAIRFELSSDIQAPVESLWAFHMEAGALETLSPWWMGLRIVDPGQGVADGSVVHATAGWWPLRFRWEALHCNVESQHCFTDVAVRSPFRYWVHHHVMDGLAPDRSRLRDVLWVLPPAWMPTFVARPLLKLGLAALFRWRHRRTRHAVAATIARRLSTAQHQPQLPPQPSLAADSNT